MKMYLISDNIDTQMGMRLAGIEGVVAHTEEEVNSAMEEVLADSDIGILLMTKKLIDMCHDNVYQLKLTGKRPLIVEIPDRHNTSKISDTISEYVREAVGIKL